MPRCGGVPCGGCSCDTGTHSKPDQLLKDCRISPLPAAVSTDALEPWRGVPNWRQKWRNNGLYGVRSNLTYPCTESRTATAIKKPSAGLSDEKVVQKLNQKGNGATMGNRMPDDDPTDYIEHCEYCKWGETIKELRLTFAGIEACEGCQPNRKGSTEFIGTPPNGSYKLVQQFGCYWYYYELVPTFGDFRMWGEPGCSADYWGQKPVIYLLIEAWRLSDKIVVRLYASTEIFGYWQDAIFFVGYKNVDGDTCIQDVISNGLDDCGYNDCVGKNGSCTIEAWE